MPNKTSTFVALSSTQTHPTLEGAHIVRMDGPRSKPVRDDRRHLERQKGCYLWNGVHYHRPPLYAGGAEAEPGPGRPARRDRGGERCNARPDRPGLGAGPEAVDRADSLVPRNSRTWWTTSRRSISNSLPASSRTSNGRCRESRSTGPATRKSWRNEPVADRHKDQKR